MYVPLFANPVVCYSKRKNTDKAAGKGPGKIIGVGNGNPSSHEPDKALQRMAFNGYCLVQVQSDKTAGKIRLTASSEKLKGSEVIIMVNQSNNSSMANK
jgi:beta-galactosidase